MARCKLEKSFVSHIDFWEFVTISLSTSSKIPSFGVEMKNFAEN
jgi:hypothetical protein